MSKLMNGLSAVVIYVLVGHALAVAMIIGVVALKGGFSHDKLEQIMAVIQGVDLLALREKVEEDRAHAALEKASLADVAEARARKSRDFEMREQELRNQLARTTTMQAQLADTADRYYRMKQDFENRLKNLREGAIATNLENARSLLENVKPKQAKEQLQKMIEDGEMKQVVTLFAAMPIEKQSKISAEFKTPEESKQLADILRLIRAGEPEVTLIDEADKQAKSVGN
ncbi:MAG: hypothetical protein JNK76_06745 [Planctomycetales bacterium]|nr:hypothetical protein [Planctomycetales bacterium]MBN8628689.1 hypothetical protein [Planctomycetota bacterium]